VALIRVICVFHNQSRVCVFDHELCSFTRKRRIDRKIGRTRFQDTEQRDDHLRGTFQGEPDQRLRSDPTRREIVRQTICTLVQFGKASGFPEPISPFELAPRALYLTWAILPHYNNTPEALAASSADLFDAIQSARARGIDVVMADTAGRLPTQAHLMEEIRKVKRVITKADAAAPHETWLVLDANTGQNAVRQVQAFDKALGLTGLIVTKLDGTAKGGAVAGIAMEHPVPILFIGIGEKPEDLRPFVAAEFVEALFT